MRPTWDVVVAGAGPAGATTAALLARHGRRVLVLEKEAFPRFRIGESLLPACVPVIDELELDHPPDTYVWKYGATFVCERSQRAQEFVFGDALPGMPHHAWHVERSLFDAQLRDRARDFGAEVRHEESVTGVAFEDDAVQVTSSKGTETARYFVDATGQNRLLARRMDAVRHFERFGLSSVYTHFEGTGAARDEVFGEQNLIRIMIVENGWGWIIPLPSGRVSIGIASTERLKESDLDEGLLAGPLARRITEGARRLETRIVGNYGYENTRPRGARYATVGDACAFLDPVFSSGVTLALQGASRLAAVLAPALEAGTESDPRLLDEHAASMDRAHRTFAALIDRFYHSRFVDSFFLGESPPSEMRRGIMSVLAGDVWREGNPFQEMLLRGRSAESFGRSPEESAV